MHRDCPVLPCLGHESVLVDDMNQLLVKIQIVPFQMNDLIQPHAGQDRKHSNVLQQRIINYRQELLEILFAEVQGKCCWDLRLVDLPERILFDDVSFHHCLEC